MKALLIIFDLTNPESLDNIDNHINLGKNYFEICKKYKGNIEGEVIKQPELFDEQPHHEFSYREVQHNEL